MHWMALMKIPKNGESAMREINDHLKDIRKERKRVLNVANRITSDANDAKDLIKEGNVITNHSD